MAAVNMDMEKATKVQVLLTSSEYRLLSDVQEHLDITIDKVSPEMKVPVNEFDGKVSYGKRRTNAGGTYKGHVESLAPAVKELAELEKRAQTSFIEMKYKKKFMSR